MKYRFLCILITTILVLGLISTVIGSSFGQTDRAISFITDALQLDLAMYQTSESHWGSLTAGGWMDVSRYGLTLATTNLSVTCGDIHASEGLLYIGLKSEGESSEIPRCMQPSLSDLDRVRDFLERYRDWTHNATLNLVMDLLIQVDPLKNMTVTQGDWTLTVESSPYYSTWYWQYTVNSSTYRGLGITILDKYVFFRDDRLARLPPQDPPPLISSSACSIPLSVSYPDPDSSGVRRNTSIGLFAPRPVGLLELYLNPNVKIANFSKEMVLYSAEYTVHFTEFLQPLTTYTATIIYGQTIPPSIHHAPICIKSWSFTTGNFPNPSPTPTPTESPTSTATPTSTPSPTPETSTNEGFSLPMEVIIGIAVVIIIIIGIVAFKLRNRRKI